MDLGRDEFFMLQGVLPGFEGRFPGGFELLQDLTAPPFPPRSMMWSIKLHGMDHLLMGLAAHPVRHAVEVPGMEIGHHGQVDVVGFQFIFYLFVHQVTHLFSDHRFSPLNRSV
jgi:hypothetical protein